MTWEQRLRELVLAGGTLAAVACSDNNRFSSFGPADGGSPRDASSTPPTYDAPNECCNVNPDPCCEFKYCGAPITPACECELDGGTWSSNANSTGGACELDSGAGDAGGDGETHD